MHITLQKATALIALMKNEGQRALAQQQHFEMHSNVCTVDLEFYIRINIYWIVIIALLC